MQYDLNLHIMPDRYKVDSVHCGFHADDAALCITTKIGGKECFLAIGEPTSRFASDPEYRRLNEKGQLRHFDPFSLTAFDPTNAASVVRFYVQKSHRIMRKNKHPWLQEAYQYFWDKCHLTMQLDGYKTLVQTARNTFEKEIESMLMVKTWRLN